MVRAARALVGGEKPLASLSPHSGRPITSGRDRTHRSALNLFLDESRGCRLSGRVRGVLMVLMTEIFRFFPAG